MTINLSRKVVVALREEYPFLITPAAVREMTEEIVWAWCRDRRRTKATLAEHPASPEGNAYDKPKPGRSLKECACDFTNHCPVHGSQPIPRSAQDDYICQP